MTEHEKRIREALEAGPVQYACHVDGPGDIDMTCVLDSNRPQDCIYARRLHEKGLCKTDCAEWKPINAPKSTVEISAANLRALLADLDAVRGALKFYADGNHFVRADADAWETVSGEPPNFWEDEANTATVEDGTVARAALKGATA